MLAPPSMRERYHAVGRRADAKAQRSRSAQRPVGDCRTISQRRPAGRRRGSPGEGPKGWGPPVADGLVQIEVRALVHPAQPLQSRGGPIPPAPRCTSDPGHARATQRSAAASSLRITAARGSSPATTRSPTRRRSSIRTSAGRYRGAGSITSGPRSTRTRGRRERQREHLAGTAARPARPRPSRPDSATGTQPAAPRRPGRAAGDRQHAAATRSTRARGREAAGQPFRAERDAEDQQQRVRAEELLSVAQQAGARQAFATSQRGRRRSGGAGRASTTPPAARPTGSPHPRASAAQPREPPDREARTGPSPAARAPRSGWPASCRVPDPAGAGEGPERAGPVLRPGGERGDAGRIGPAAGGVVSAATSQGALSASTAPPARCQAATPQGGGPARASGGGPSAAPGSWRAR